MRYSNDIKLVLGAGLMTSAFCAMHPSAAREQQRIVCPPAVDAGQISVTSPAGWTGWYLPDSTVKLDSAGIMLGPIRMNGVMMGEADKLKDGTVVNRFPLTGGDAPQLEKWVVCNYGSHLFQAIKLPIATRECAVVYWPEKGTKKGNPHYVVSDITCK